MTDEIQFVKTTSTKVQEQAEERPQVSFKKQVQWTERQLVSMLSGRIQATKLLSKAELYFFVTLAILHHIS